MKKIIEKVKGKITDCIEIKIRKICLGMNKDTRIIVAASILVISAFGSVFILATAVYQAEKHKGLQEMKIEHITPPELLINPEQGNNLKSEVHEKE